MKKRHIAAGLIVLSLIAVTFIATAAAVTYYPTTLPPIKQGKKFTFIIDTSSAWDFDHEVEITNFGLDVDTSTITLTLTDAKNNPIQIDVDWTQIAVNPDGSSIEIYLVKQDGVPSHGNSMLVVAQLYDGNDIAASGPGWGWGGHY